LSKVTKPTTGHFKINGRIASLLEVGTGFHPEMTGRENIYLNGAILGMHRSEITRKFEEIVDFADVSKYIDTPVKRYSSGMYVRLAFAVAAHLESEILIVDEVLAVGDVEFQKKCLDKMGNVTKSEGRTVLFVSHNLTSISKLCYKSMLIENGNLKNFTYTSEIIDIYLNRKSLLGPATSDFSKSDNLQFTFKRYSVKNALGEICNKFKFNQQIFIELEFDVLNSLSKLEISLSILNISGDTILWSNLSDSFGNNFQSFTLGSYLAKISIPENLLFEGIYFVGISCHYPGVMDLDRRLEAFSFEIFSDSIIINNAGTNLRSNFMWDYNKLV
jgi:lipopolysaccharide transport system ATP-binding protein